MILKPGKYFGYMSGFHFCKVYIEVNASSKIALCIDKISQPSLIGSLLEDDSAYLTTIVKNASCIIDAINILFIKKEEDVLIFKYKDNNYNIGFLQIAKTDNGIGFVLDKKEYIKSFNKLTLSIESFDFLINEIQKFSENSSLLCFYKKNTDKELKKDSDFPKKEVRSNYNFFNINISKKNDYTVNFCISRVKKNNFDIIIDIKYAYGSQIIQELKKIELFLVSIENKRLAIKKAFFIWFLSTFIIITVAICTFFALKFLF